MYSLIASDSLEAMKTFQTDTFDSVVTDPPYGIKFMGKEWDHGVPSSLYWAEALRVAKPGAHLLSFGGTRTFHRLACAIEDAGWELRDTIMWVYGSGFPKSLNISKAIDKAAGATREVVGYDESRVRPNRLYEGGAIGNVGGTGKVSDRTDNGATITAPSTPDAIKWDGWGTALKPAWEPIIVARKPLIGSVVENVLAHGTGGLNIDASRIPLEGDYKSKPNGRPSQTGLGDNYKPELANIADTVGRFPANLIHDGSEEVQSCFPFVTSGNFSGRRNKPKTKNTFGAFVTQDEPARSGSAGSASRFFYCAKASQRDRNDGMKDGQTNEHPTVKPTELMRYLVRLVTPPAGRVLDPFAGSGSTVRAAIMEGFEGTGIDLDEANIETAKLRCAAAMRMVE